MLLRTIAIVNSYHHSYVLFITTLILQMIAQSKPDKNKLPHQNTLPVNGVDSGMNPGADLGVWIGPEPGVDSGEESGMDPGVNSGVNSGVDS